jgi:alpha-galactosidase
VPIHVHDTGREFHLRSERLSYVVRLLEDGRPSLLHFGGPLDPSASYRHLDPASPLAIDNWGEELRLECPTPGGPDFRCPALTVEQADGSRVLELACTGHRVLPGKPALPGLPATYVERDEESETLELELADERSGTRAVLVYTVFRDLPVVTRHLRIRNGGAAPFVLRCAMSASLDLPEGPWDLTQLSGAWARERQVVRRRVVQGSQSVASLRGHSSHHQNPFLLLERPGTTEDSGEAYGLGLVYSGNFLAEVEGDAAGGARARIGIHPDTFSWRLEPGEEFCTPEAVLVFSDQGRGGLSDVYHRLYRERLARGPWRDRPRPVLLNNWEATYFDFDEARLLRLATSARDLGVELFVLDDGWFGERDSDHTSLGDWTPDRRKLPGGLAGIARQVEALGLGFGIWIEPEMVSRRSRLFTEHPEWAVGAPGRRHTEARHQYVLDLTRPEVAEWIHGTVAGILRSAPIRYVKWDMNRSITEAYSSGLPSARQGEFHHRYMLALYELYRRLTAEFPEVLFESCSGGGGRFDPGMLAFAPQAWTSDGSDAIERLGIQWGTSLCYPLSAMGAHVSAVPNHQVGRITSLVTRAAVAFFGVFGYELDPLTLSPAEREEVAAQVAFYRSHRDLFQRGRLVRLVSPFEEERNAAAWMCVSPDARRAVVGYYRLLQHACEPAHRLRLRGLEPAARYRISTWPSGGDPPWDDAPALHGGDELMRAGLPIRSERHFPPRRGDFWSQLFLLEAS